MHDKKDLLENLRWEIGQKFSAEQRLAEMGKIVGSLLSTVTARLIKDTGYSVVSTVLKREIHKIAKQNAEDIMKLFDLKETSPENTSKLLKLVALILGLKLDVVGEETVVRRCPQADMAKELKEPFLCNICHEYAKGMVEGTLGENFDFEILKSMGDGDEYCAFKTKEKR